MLEIKTLGAFIGVISNYRQNKSINKNAKEIQQIKNKLGLSQIEIRNKDMFLIKFFIDEVVKSNQTLENIFLTEEEIFNKLDNVNKSELSESLLELDSFGFFDKDYILSVGNRYSLKYSLFYTSNYIEKISEGSCSYLELFVTVTNYLEKNSSNNIDVNVQDIIEKLPINEFLLNPILYHLNELGVVKLSKVIGKCKTELIAYDFKVDISKLKKEMRV